MRRGPIDRLMTWPVLRTVLAVLLLVQAISFAEAFTGNLETVLDLGARVTDFLRLQLYEMPDTLPLALPAALIVGLYSTLIVARREGALVVLTAAGIRPLRLLALALSFGAVGAGLTLTVTGELLPRARLAERALLHDMRTFARIEALESSDFGLVIRDVPGITLIFGANDRLALAEEAEVLMINHRATSWRFAQAAAARAVRGDESEAPSLRLDDAHALGLPGEGGFGAFSANEMIFAFSSEEYFPPFDANLRAPEVPRLTCLADPDLPCPDGAWSELARGALLAPIAAFFALLAVAFDRALWIRGSGLVLALAGSVLADVLTRAAVAATPLAAPILAVLLIAATIFLLARHQARLIRPPERV